MYREDVLDHGYVELVESWGRGIDSEYSDTSDCERGIIEAARQSTQGSFRGWEPADCDCRKLYEDLLRLSTNPDDHLSDCARIKSPGDRRLLSFLWHNLHATPFEFSGMVLEVQAPIFIFREWHRHRTFSYNEMSARYAPLPNLNYIPSIPRIMLNNSSGNKQAGAVKGSDEITPEAAENFQTVLSASYGHAEVNYQAALARGVPKELARCLLPVGRYSRMRVSGNLRCWVQFLSLRLDPAAQWEIRQFARGVGLIMKETFPQTYSLLQPSKRLIIEHGGE